MLWTVLRSFLWGMFLVCAQALTPAFQIKLPPISSNLTRFGVAVHTSRPQLLAPDYSDTFRAVSDALMLPLDIHVYSDEDDLFAAVANASVQAFVSSGSAYMCMAYQFGVTPVASLIELADGEPSPYVAGAIVVRSDDTSITDLPSLVGKSIACSGLTQLAGCQSQWLVLHDAGLDLLQIAKAVLYGANSLTILSDIAAGTVDRRLRRSRTARTAQCLGQDRRESTPYPESADCRLPLQPLDPAVPWPPGVSLAGARRTRAGDHGGNTARHPAEQLRSSDREILEFHHTGRLQPSPQPPG